VPSFVKRRLKYLINVALDRIVIDEPISDLQRRLSQLLEFLFKIPHVHYPQPAGILLIFFHFILFVQIGDSQSYLLFILMRLYLIVVKLVLFRALLQ
jgi:hypothetical protein